MCVCAPWVLVVSFISLLSIFLMCHSFNVCVCSVGSWGQFISLLSIFLMCHSFNVCVCSVGSWGQFISLLSIFLMCHSFNVCVCSVGSWGQCHIFAFNIPDVSFLQCVCVCAPWVLVVSFISLLSIFLMCHSFNVCVCSVGSWGQCHIFAFNIPDVSFLQCVCVCAPWVLVVSVISLLSIFLMCHSFNVCVCVLRGFLGSVSYLCFQYS